MPQNQGEEFAHFGRSRLISLRPVGSQDVRLADAPADSRRLIRQRCPRQPGVYGMVDDAGRLIYVGKSKCLRQRLLTYFSSAESAHKAGRIAQRARRLVWEPAPHELTATVRELELIRHWRPRFNVQGQPGRGRRTFVCLGRAPAPYLYLASVPGRRAQATFGPVRAGRRLSATLRLLNDLFRLRDCPDQVRMTFADQRELFPRERSPQCLRHQLGTCLAPCAAYCTTADYAAQVRGCRALLDGTDRRPLDALLADLAAAAAALKFERAARLRDAYDDLAWLERQLERLRTARRDYSFVYPLTGECGREVWHWIARGQIFAVTWAPQSAAGLRRCRELAERLEQPAAQPAMAEDVGMLLIVAGWFRKYPAELERTRRPAELRAVLA